MTKNELIQYLKAYVQAENTSFKAHNQVLALKRKLSALEKEQEPIMEEKAGLGVGIATFFIYWIPGSIIFSIILAIIRFIAVIRHPYEDGFIESLFTYAGNRLQVASSHPIIFHFEACAAVFIIVAIFLAIITIHSNNKTYPARNAKKMEEYKKKVSHIPELRNQLSVAQSQEVEADHCFEQLKARNILPKRYCSGWEVEYFIQYLEDGRADTLKEAINLWVYELDAEDRAQKEQKFRQEVLAHARVQQETLDAIQRESERAADAAEDTAFWEKTSTFITADALDKIRKDINEK